MPSLLQLARGSKLTPCWKDASQRSNADAFEASGLMATAVSSEQASKALTAGYEDVDTKGMIRRPVGLIEKIPPPELAAKLSLTFVEPRRAVVRHPAIDWAVREAREFKLG